MLVEMMVPIFQNHLIFYFLNYYKFIGMKGGYNNNIYVKAFST